MTRSQSRLVPPISARRRIPKRAIDGVVRDIARQFKPEAIVLFGSYGNGDPRPESDVDLLVVMETSLKDTEQAIRICESIQYHFGLDLIVRTPSMLSRRLALGDSFLRTVLREGKVLYGRIDI